MLDGGPIVVDFSDVSIDSEGHILICDHLLDLVEYELFFNKLAAATNVIIKQRTLEEFINFYPEAFDKKDIIIDE
jgi:hypothetical protein